MRKVVVYYRSRTTRTLQEGSAVTLLQKRVVEQWARYYESGPDSGAWKIIGQYHDNYRGRDNVIRSDLPGLDKALDHCERNDATLVFVNIKMWRPNPFIDDRIAQFVRRHGDESIFVISTRSDSGAHEIIEFFQNEKAVRDMAKKRAKRSNATKRGIREAKEKKGEVRDADEFKKAQQRGGQIKRAKSLRKLLFLCNYIIELRVKNPTNQQLAEALNKRGFMTVSRKSWTAANISKAKHEINSPGFRDKVIAAMALLNRGRVPPTFVDSVDSILRKLSDDAHRRAFGLPLEPARKVSDSTTLELP